MRTVRNLINGTPRDALSGATSELIDPATGKVFGTAPLSGEADVDAAYQAATAAAPGWGGAHRPNGSARCSASPTWSRPARTISSRPSHRTPASRWELTRTEELTAMVDQMRFFAGAARLLEGKSAGEYMAGQRPGFAVNPSASSVR